MATALMMVLATAKPGQADSLDSWYDSRHIPDLLAVPGVKSARRYDVRPMKLPEGIGPQFLALYEIEADDIDSVLMEVGRRNDTEAMPSSPALDSDKTIAVIAFPKQES